MSGLAKYRIKTHEELLDSGFCLTPGGVYVHPEADELSPEMIEYASRFDQRLIAQIFARLGQRQWVDRYMFCAGHFAAEPLLNVVK